MSVANAEHLETMIKYCQDPINSPKPSLRIENIKEYKDVAETLYKIVSGATPSGKDKGKSPMFDALSPPQSFKQVEQKPEEPEASTLLAQVITDEQANS